MLRWLFPIMIQTRWLLWGFFFVGILSSWGDVTPTPNVSSSFPSTPTHTPTPTITPLPAFVPKEQVFDLDPYPYHEARERLSYVQIDKQAGTIGEVEQTNFRAGLYNSVINQTGEVLFYNGRTLKLKGEGTEIATLADYVYPSWLVPIQMDSFGRQVAVRMYGPTGINIYDLLTGALLGHMSLPSNTFDIRTSQNLATFAFNQLFFGSHRDVAYLTVLDWDGERFSEPVKIFSEVDESPTISEIHVSSFGNRIFFNSYKYSSKTSQIHCFERTSAGWVEKELRGFPVLPANSYLNIYDIGNDGTTLLILWDREKGFALMHENEAGWSEPEYIGTPPNMYFYQVQMSEDGRVVSLWRIHEPLNTIYIYIKSDSGEWVEHIIDNPGGVGVEGILMSEDGKRLYWAPLLLLLGIDQQEWMMH